MTTIRVELPDALAAELARRAMAAGLSGPGALLAALALVAGAAPVGSRVEVERRLVEALESVGPRVEMTPENWASLRREGKALLAALRGEEGSL